MPIAVWGLLLLLCFVWSLSFLTAEILLETTLPFTIVFYRVFIASLIMIVLMWAMGKRIPYAPRALFLLFVMGLLLLVGWNRRLILTVTAFTVGHSVTLAMVTLGLFDYPVSLVEFMIALSIYLLAVELATGRAGALWRQPWWLAGGFGLLHGMGFAGALAETGLPQSNVPLALLFFNVGIELGQLAFIGLLVICAAVGSTLLPRGMSQLRPVPVYILGALSAMWCIERGLEVLA